MGSVSPQSTMARIPERRVRTLDFAQFRHGEPSGSRGFCRELVDCLSSLGFVKIRNHGISGQEIENVFVMVRWCKGFRLFQKSDKANSPSYTRLEPAVFLTPSSRQG